MKTEISTRIQLVVLILITYSLNSYSQNEGPDCKVLLKEISGSYKGDCNNGLAHGKGTATGEDTYTGTFVNGLPEGKGEYKYKNGTSFSGYWKKGLKNGKGEFKNLVNGKTVIIKGYWKDGEYAGPTAPDEEYRITNLAGIENYSITKLKGDQDIIEISFEKVNKKYIPRDLEITISSGYKIEQNKKNTCAESLLPCAMRFTFHSPDHRRI